MEIRKNPKLYVLYGIMALPLSGVAFSGAFLWRVFQPRYHSDITMNSIFSVITLVLGVVYWKPTLHYARQGKKFLEACAAVKRGEIVLILETQEMAEFRELSTAFNERSESLDTGLANWILASQDHHRIFVTLVKVISDALDQRDFYLRGHAGRVAVYATMICQELELTPEETERIRYSALLHDIGKIGMDQRILAKPGALTAEEFRIMQQHTTRGAEMLRPITALADLIPGVELHHESLDGSGYPHGLRGSQIPRMARIIAVADTFDATTMNRAYQEPLGADNALRILQRLAGEKFDPDAVAALLRIYAAGKIHLPGTQKRLAEISSTPT
jgi:putative nucleotidyltransferase with HDIG domain